MTYIPSQSAIEAARNAYLNRLGYSSGLRAALIAARAVEDTLRVESPDHPATEGSPK